MNAFDKKDRRSLFVVLIRFRICVAYVARIIGVVERYRRVVHQRTRVFVAGIIDKWQTAWAFFFPAFGFRRHGQPQNIRGV